MFSIAFTTVGQNWGQAEWKERRRGWVEGWIYKIIYRRRSNEQIASGFSWVNYYKLKHEYEDILNVNRSGSDSAELLSRGGGGKVFEEISRKIVN